MTEFRINEPKKLDQVGDGFSCTAAYDPSLFDQLEKMCGDPSLTLHFPDGTSETITGVFEPPVIIPETRWDAFKSRWFPEWLLAWFPTTTPHVTLVFTPNPYSESEQ